MIRRLILWLALSAALFASTAVAQEQPLTAATLTEERLQPIARAALEAVGERTGVELAGKVPVRIATVGEVARILAAELVPQFEAQGLDPGSAAVQAKAQAWMFARLLVAKYSFETDEILVVPAHIGTYAKLLGLEDLDSAEGLLVTIIHEAVHASDDVRYDMDRMLDAASSTDGLLACNALIEGHAQFVARSVAAELGQSEIFERFSSMFGALPADTDESTKFVLQAQFSLMVSAYTDGEKFFEHLHAAGGDEAVDRAFAEPPDSMEVVLHPGWYLDPSKRPRADFDLHAGLEKVAEHYGKDWQPIYQSLTTLQLQQAFSMLPPDRTAGPLGALRANRLLSLTRKGLGAEEQIGVVIYEFASAEDAAAMVKLSEELLREKDFRMQEGAIQIVRAEYGKLDDDDLKGVASYKVIEMNGREIGVSSSIASAGRLAVEFMHIGRKLEPKDVVKVDRVALGGVKRKAR